MARFLTKTFIIFIFAAFALSMIVPATTTVDAQDGLSEEEQALLERLEGAILTFEEYTSYTAHSVELESQSISISMAGLAFDIISTTNREIDSTYIEVDGVENIHSEALITVVESDSTSGEETAYTLQAEIRLVDGEVYVMSEYLDSEGAVSELPEGWVTVDEANLFQYAVLDIGSLLEMDEEDSSGLDEEDLFGDLERLASLVESVTVDPMELEDGTAVDLITLTIGAEGFSEYMGDDLDMGLDDAAMEEFMGTLLDSITFSIQVALDGDENVRQTSFTISVNVEEMDASFIPDVPEGMDASFSFLIEMVETTSYSDINADLEPVAAPE